MKGDTDICAKTIVKKGIRRKITNLLLLAQYTAISVEKKLFTLKKHDEPEDTKPLIATNFVESGNY